MNGWPIRLIAVLVVLMDLVAVTLSWNGLPSCSLALACCSWSAWFFSPMKRQVGLQGQVDVQRLSRAFLLGLPARMACTLASAGLMYCVCGERLGVRFWLAIVVCYQLMLALQVAAFRDAITSRPRPRPPANR